MEKTQAKPLTAAQQRQRDKKRRTWLRAGVQLFLPGHIQRHQPCQQQILELLSPKHRPLRQTERLFAVEQLFLDKPGQCPDGIAQAAKGAGVPAEKPVEQQREAAQPQ